MRPKVNLLLCFSFSTTNDFILFLIISTKTKKRGYNSFFFFVMLAVKHKYILFSLCWEFLLFCYEENYTKVARTNPISYIYIYIYDGLPILRTCRPNWIVVRPPWGALWWKLRATVLHREDCDGSWGKRLHGEDCDGSHYLGWVINLGQPMKKFTWALWSCIFVEEDCVA